MKAVNVRTQAQWDVVSKELWGEKFKPWNKYFKENWDKSYISKKGYGSIDSDVCKGYTILTFNEWLLEHCKEKYKNGVRFKNAVRGNVYTIKNDNHFMGVNNNIIVNIEEENSDGEFLGCVYYDWQFAEIITEAPQKITELPQTNNCKEGDVVIVEAQPEQREIISVIAPENLYGGLIQKGEELIRIDSHRFAKTPIIDNVHPLFIPIEVTNNWDKVYKKTEADEQAEMWEELHNDYIESDFIDEYSFYKQQTKFKLVRYEN